MKITLPSFFFLVLASVQVLALEPQNPVSLCDRFLGAAQTECEQKMKDSKPDWYLATVCNLQFEDKLFYECLSLGGKQSFSPKALEACASHEMNDADRMTCIQNSRSTLAESFQDQRLSRKPASLPHKKTHK